MNTYRVFISYTMRENYIDYNYLYKLKQILSKYSCIDTYVDILDNHESDHQGHVISMLCASDVVLLLRTPNINISNWVQKELKLAIEKKIPIVKFDYITIKECIDNSLDLDYVVNQLLDAIM